MHTWKGFYACQCADQNAFGARCRERAVAGDVCVIGHPHGPGYEGAMPPKIVLFRFTLSATAFAEAIKAGFRSFDWRPWETQAMHRLESRLVKRPFQEYRRFGDSGTAVFGKEGLVPVAAPGTLAVELEKAGLKLASGTLEAMERGGRFTLGLRHGSLPPDRQTVDPPAQWSPAKQTFVRGLLAASWGKCHVWDNIPRWHVNVPNGQGDWIPTQFHIVQPGPPPLVQVIKPHAAEGELFELPDEVHKTAFLAATSTLNFGECGQIRKDRPRVQIRWNSGYWDAEEVV